MKTCRDCPAPIGHLHGNRVRCPACTTRHAKRARSAARERDQRQAVVTWLERHARRWPSEAGAARLLWAAEQLRAGRDGGVQT